MSKQELMIHLFNAMKHGYHCWAEWGKHAGTVGWQFYCDKGRH